MKRKNKKNRYSAEEMRKKRKLKKQRASADRINIIVLLSTIFFGTLCLVFLKRPTHSELENRKLAEFPKFSWESYFSGEYTAELSEYFNDTVPYRDDIHELGAYIKKAHGIKSDDTYVFHGDVAVVADDDGNVLETEEPVTETQKPIVTESTEKPEGTSPASPVETAPPETTESETETEPEEEQNVSEFSHNGIVQITLNDKPAGIMLFGGSEKQGIRYAETINAYKEALGDDVNVYNMIVPTSVEFYLPDKLRKYSASEKDNIEKIYSHLSEDVIHVDAYSKLQEHSNEYVYFRTDHHWTPLGAYYAYTAFSEALGNTPLPISEYETKTKEGFVGSLYGYSNLIDLKNNPDTFTYYIPPVNWTTSYYDYKTLAFKYNGVLFHEYVEGENCYGMFLGADAIHTKIVTENKNSRKIVVFKESYGNAFVPFLVSDFEEIYVIDIRFFEKNAVDYIKQIGATDVLFLNNAFAANTSKLISGIENLLYSPFGTAGGGIPAETTAAETTLSAAETSAPPQETAAPPKTAAPAQ